MAASMDSTQNISNPPLLGMWFWDPSEPVATRALAMCTHNADKSVSSTRYVAHDLLKSVSALFDSSGTRQAKFEYTPYGETLTTEGAWALAMPLRYSSEYRDEDLGLIYYNYRHYNPQDGRWISRDPIGEEGSINLYGFCKNKCISTSDFLGLSNSSFSIELTPGREMIYIATKSQSTSNWWDAAKELWSESIIRLGYEIVDNLFVTEGYEITETPFDFDPNSRCKENECIKKMTVIMHGYTNGDNTLACVQWGDTELFESDVQHDISNQFKGIHFCRNCTVEIRACNVGKVEALKEHLEKVTKCNVIVHKGKVHAWVG